MSNSITFFGWNSFTLYLDGKVASISASTLPISWHEIEHLFWGEGVSPKEEATLLGKSLNLKAKLGLYDYCSPAELFAVMAFDTSDFGRWYQKPVFPKTFYLHEDGVFENESKLLKRKYYAKAISFTREQLVYELVQHHSIFVEDILDELFYGFDSYGTLVVYAAFWEELFERWHYYPVLKGLDESRAFVNCIKAD